MGTIYGWKTKAATVKAATNDKALASHLDGKVFYQLVTGEADGIEFRAVTVDLLRNDGSRLSSRWGVKSLDETMNPYYYGAPLDWLPLLESHPIPERIAGMSAMWRACWQNGGIKPCSQ